MSKINSLMLLYTPIGERDFWTLHWTDHAGDITEMKSGDHWNWTTRWHGSRSYAVLSAYHGMKKHGLDVRFLVAVGPRLVDVADLCVFKSPTLERPYISTWTEVDKTQFHWGDLGEARLFVGGNDEMFAPFAERKSWVECADKHLTYAAIKKALEEFMEPTW